MKKPFFSLAVMLILLLATATAVYASDIGVSIDGQEITFPDQAPLIVDGRTLVPVRGVFEALGFDVDWNDEERAAVLTSPNYQLIIPIGSYSFTTNGTVHTLDVPAQIISGRTMLPIRFPLESVGYTLAWDPATRTVVITSNAPVRTAPVVNAALTPAQVFAKNRDSAIIIRGYTSDGWYITGSGFIICPSGIAVTNHHVMDDVVEAWARLYDGREFDIIGYISYDFGNDLALIQIDGEGYNFSYATLGNSDGVSVGDTVFAIGGPNFANLTFTSGMITLLDRGPSQLGAQAALLLLQHSAAIYGGSSGGPLLNDSGQVIGVNVASYEDRASAGLAVPINKVVLPAPGAEVNPLPIGAGRYFDPVLIGMWKFTSSTSSMYSRWLEDGCILDYVFLPEGIGYWADFCTTGHYRRLWFDWYTYDGQVVITYHTINLILVYQYRINRGVLELWNEQEEISLVSVESQQPPENSQFVGAWFGNMDLDLDMGYGVHNYNIYLTLHSDGTGEENLYWSEGEWWYIYIDLTWSVTNGVMTILTEYGIERWIYSISDDTMTLYRNGFTLAFERI